MKKAVYMITLLVLFGLSNTINAQPLEGGRAFSIAVCDNNSVWAQGFNDDGQLGNGTNTSGNVPVQVSFLTEMNAIPAGEQHSIARKNDGSAWVWGNNGNGELGNGTNTNSNVPLQLSGLCPVLSLDEITDQLSASVFPNPNNGHFTLTLANENGIVEIYNMLG